MVVLVTAIHAFLHRFPKDVNARVSAFGLPGHDKKNE